MCTNVSNYMVNRRFLVFFINFFIKSGLPVRGHAYYLIVEFKFTVGVDMITCGCLCHLIRPVW